MGRPPSNGGPSFRFNQAEIAEMEAILQAHKTAMPERQVLVNLAEKFSKSEERSGKIEVQMKQVWNWFQNRRYAIRAKAAKTPGRLNMTPMVPEDSTMVKGVPVPQVTQPHVASSVNVRSLPQVPQHPTVPAASVRTFPQAPQQPHAFSVQSAGRMSDNSQMEYEAKSARDGAWYDVSTFLSHRSLDTGDPEVFVRFAGFGAEEDEWVNVRKNVRQRSLPCEASECVAVLPADLILCFQEGKEQALYFDAHVLDAQRRRHDVRGCRCRFLVRYDHDQSEEIVALRKICRRPETDYRLQQLHAVNESITVNNQNKNGGNNNAHTVSTLRVYPPAEVQPKQLKVEPTVPPEKRQRLDSTVPVPAQPQLKVEPNVQQNQPTVQPAAPAPPEHRVEPVVNQPSDQNVVPVVHTRSDDVQVELQNVQPMMPDLITEEPKAVGPAVTPSAGTQHEGEPEAQKEPEVSGSLVEVQAELHDVQPDTSSLETKTEEPMLHVSGNEPNAVEETIEIKTEEPVSSSDPNVVQVARTEGPVVLVDPDVVHKAKTEESAVVVDPDVVQEAKTEEPVVPVEPNAVQEAKTEVPVVPVDSNASKTEEPVDPKADPEAKTEEPLVLVDPDEAKTEEPVMPVNPNVTHEAKTEEHVDPNVAKTEEHVDPNEAKTEEHVDPNVAHDAKTEEHAASVNDPMVIEREIEQSKVSETVEINEGKYGNVAPENDDVAMEEG